MVSEDVKKCSICFNSPTGGECEEICKTLRGDDATNRKIYELIMKCV